MTDVPPEAIAAAAESCPFVNRDALQRVLEAAAPLIAAAERQRIRHLDRHLDPYQTATVLEQIADHSSGDDIREHIQQVAEALRGDGLIFMNGPPQQAMRDAASGARHDRPR